MNNELVKTIAVEQLHALSQSQPVELIDVRTADELRQVRTAFARHVPLDSIDPHDLMQTRKRPASEPMYFICHVGGRSGWACAAMMAAGYPNVINVVGGIEAWEAAGLPVERG